jgi:hypothetical protein
MNQEPVVAPVVVEQPVEVHHTEGLEQPAPSEQQQQVADDVFSKEQEQAVAALLALQTGMGMLHNLAVDTFGKPAAQPQPIPPRVPPDEDAKR